MILRTSLLLVSVALCSSDVKPSSVEVSLNDTGFKLFQQLLREDAQDNVVFSPLSLGIALHWLHAGSAGHTRRAMNSFLGTEGDVMASQLGSIIQTIGTAPVYNDDIDEDDDIEDVVGVSESVIRLVNILLHHADVSLHEGFREASEGPFWAQTSPLDPSRPGLVEEINGQVEKLTAGKIRDLLRPDHISDDTRLILLNVLYFKDKWQEPFKPYKTVPRAFHLDSSSHQMVPTMQMTTQLQYADTPAGSAVILRFETSSMEMVLVKPKGTPENLLEQGVLSNLLGQFRYREVNIRLPKFTVETKLDFERTLKSLGLGDLFVDGRADFSGMTSSGKKELVLSALLHQTYISVSEVGCEAAAATAGVMRLTRSAPMGPPPTPFHLDRPFLYLLRRGDLVLFSGLTRLFPGEEVVRARTEL